jgi:mannan endo-1,4-beta-mannosidase
MLKTLGRKLTSRFAANRTSSANRYVRLVVGIIVTVGAVMVCAQPWLEGQWSEGSTHPARSVRYLGIYEPDAPHSYSGIDRFAQAIDVQPNIVSYYSSLTEPFQVNFAAAAAKRGATILDQIGAQRIPFADITKGKYDHYLRSYASAVKAFGAPVILSFDHEMNGSWYPYGYRHASPAAFVAAWRHIVTVFRQQGTRNVIWLWTVNIVNTYNNKIPDPAPWWPGSSYVNWVGIDGYYYTTKWTFDSLFGPTIADIRRITNDPILISETGAASAADQTAKISDLFAGVRTYGLLGFLWFDMNGETNIMNWRITSPKALAVFRKDAKAFMMP